MSRDTTKDGRLRCSFDRDSHAHRPRLRPCNRLAVAKHQPKGSIVYSYYCDEHAERIINQNNIVQHSSRGFLVKEGAGASEQIIPLSEDKDPQIVRGMGQAIQRITRKDRRYPERIRSFEQAPELLSCLGNVSLLETPSLAIIGMQQPTQWGRRLAYRVAAFFARAGYIIVSGLAQGIDTAAHEGALSVGGRTIAVLEAPLGNFYPFQNRDLAQAIVQRKGLLFTSYYTDAPVPDGIMKPIYLQASLSSIVIPIQTGVKGNTLFICRKAQSQGRGLWVPRPNNQDEEQYPECYAGIRLLLQWKDVVPIVGKEGYSLLLEHLRSMHG
ncbi:MAG TPA: DNA-processing protein DprA [Ktedonobacteraceae bacterium]|nr:DNA-processing protein DprA [Ktedonobacteraceae bacterium]